MDKMLATEIVVPKRLSVKKNDLRELIVMKLEGLNKIINPKQILHEVVKFRDELNKELHMSQTEAELRKAFSRYKNAVYRRVNAALDNKSLKEVSNFDTRLMRVINPGKFYELEAIYNKLICTEEQPSQSEIKPKDDDDGGGGKKAKKQNCRAFFRREDKSHNEYPATMWFQQQSKSPLLKKKLVPEKEPAKGATEKTSDDDDTDWEDETIKSRRTPTESWHDSDSDSAATISKKNPPFLKTSYDICYDVESVCDDKEKTPIRSDNDSNNNNNSTIEKPERPLVPAAKPAKAKQRRRVYTRDDESSEKIVPPAKGIISQEREQGFTVPPLVPVAKPAKDKQRRRMYTRDDESSESTGPVAVATKETNKTNSSKIKAAEKAAGLSVPQAPAVVVSTEEPKHSSKATVVVPAAADGNAFIRATCDRWKQDIGELERLAKQAAKEVARWPSLAVKVQPLVGAVMTAVRLAPIVARGERDIQAELDQLMDDIRRIM